MAQQTETLGVDKIFMEQAQSLAKGGEVLPSLEDLAKRLQKAAQTRQPMKVKLGLDPTRPDLHLGHTVVLKKLRAFQDLGHEAILIIGDATAMIGDPSGKKETRPALTVEEVEANAQTYLEQAGKVLDTRKAKIVRNSEWFSTMVLGDFLKLAAKATVAQILERDDFSQRYASGKPIYLHELFYPLMQGYDSVMIDSDIELGGTDQRFNNLMGRELQSAEGRTEPQLVLLAPLLEGTDGKIKMSKTYPDHCVNLTDPPEEFYGKLMSIPDELIPRYELLLTPMTEDQIKEQMRLIGAPQEQGGIHPRDVKATLAKWLVSQFYSIEESEQAEQAFIKQFRNKEIPDDIPEVTVGANREYPIVDFLAEHDLAPSKSEARRLIQGGGVRFNNTKVADESLVIFGTPNSEAVIQVGKRRFLRVLFR